MEFGILSIIPPLVAIILAFVLKDAVVALIAAVFTGYLIIVGGNPITGFGSMLDGIIAVFQGRWLVIVTIVIALAFGMSRLIEESGAGNGLVKYLTEKRQLIKSKKGACFLTWLIGLVLYSNATLSMVLTGVVMKPLNDEMKISHEKQALIIKTTGPPVCGLIPIGQWGGVLIGLMTAAGITDLSRMLVQVSCMNFYCIITVVSILVLILLNKDFFGIKKAEERAEKFGYLDDPDTPEFKLMQEAHEQKADEKEEKISSPALVLVPTLSTLGIAIGYMIYSGEGNLLNGDAVGGVFWAMILSSVICIVMNLVAKTFKFSEIMNIFIRGMGDSMQILVILVVAVTLGSVVTQLGTGAFLANTFSGFMSPKILPALLFVITCVIGFATGSASGNASTMMPIAIPWAMAAGANLPLCIAAVWGAAFFGDHVSPISDSTYMVCGISRCNVVSHIKTILPYGLIWAGISLVCFLVAGLVL